MWYLYILAYYSVIRKNEIMPCAATWIDLEIVILSEVSQTEKQKHHKSLCMQNFKSNDIKEFIYKTETDSWTWKMSLWLPRGTSYRIREKKEQRIGVGIKESTLLMDSVMSEKC